MSRTVSVIMGIYNCEATLADAIDSVLNQTFDDFELIMCNDGSTDNTPEIAREYAEKYPDRIILISNEKNSGLHFTLNHCLEYASGKYIARMDGDDICLKNRFQVQVAYLDSHPDIAVVGTGYFLFDDGGIWGSLSPEGERSLLDVFNGISFAHPTTMMRADALRSVGGYTVSVDTTRAEDYDLWCKLYAKGCRGANIPEVLFKYREDKNSYKKRNFRHCIERSRLIRKWHRALGVGSSLRFLRPVIVGLTPKFIYRLRHRSRFQSLSE